MSTYEQLKAAKKAAPGLAGADTEQKNQALTQMAKALLEQKDRILQANAQDLCRAEGVISPVMLDRLKLTDQRLSDMAEGILQVAALPDPVGRVLEQHEHPKGMVIQKVGVPMGVVAIIYESRPNVASDAAALAVKSGNACVLRCGKEAKDSTKAIVEALQIGLERSGFDPALVQLVEDASRESAKVLMEAVGLVDLLIPRGGPGLIKACTENAKVPCIQTGTGICHIYVDEKADLDMALSVLTNAKTSRPSVCNAAEVLLVHRAVAETFLPMVEKAFAGKVELRLCPESGKIIVGVPAGPEDFDREFLDYILAVRVVDSLQAAISHIKDHSTGHSEAIITENKAAAGEFIRQVDSAAVYVNCSTRFTDGGEFGLGCEMGISTQKLHARGPMGLQELCSYKYVITGSGQTR